MKRIIALMLLALLVGCTRTPTQGPGEVSNLERWTREVSQKPSPPLDPLPSPSQFESVSYNVPLGRDPFSPLTMLDQSANAGIRPNADRPRQPLEAFPLDALKMVGTVGAGSTINALVMSPDKVTHRVHVGQFLGQNDGRVTSISLDRISLMETVSDGAGGWEQKEASILLDGQQ